MSKVNINLKEEKRDWDTFVEKALSACMNRNKDLKDYSYSLLYSIDEIDLTYNKVIDGIPYELKTVTLDKIQYEEGNKSDKDILVSLFNTIQSSS